MDELRVAPKWSYDRMWKTENISLMDCVLDQNHLINERSKMRRLDDSLVHACMYALTVINSSSSNAGYWKFLHEGVIELLRMYIGGVCEPEN